MLAWLVLLALIVVEAIAIRWWLARQLFPFFFNGWAASLYSLLLAADVAVAWLISMSYEPGGTPGLQLMLLIGIGLVIIIILATLFFRWAVRLEMTDLSDKDKRS
jgi:hypothetical protein